jgi:nitrate reductase NapAB chaperone NapD
MAPKDDRFVDDVPRLDLPPIMAHHCADVIRQLLGSILPCEYRGEPGRICAWTVPAKIVAMHQHPVTLTEVDHPISVIESVRIGSRMKPGPFELVARSEQTEILSNKLSKLRDLEIRLAGLKSHLHLGPLGQFLKRRRRTVIGWHGCAQWPREQESGSKLKSIDQQLSPGHAPSSLWEILAA